MSAPIIDLEQVDAVLGNEATERTACLALAMRLLRVKSGKYADRPIDPDALIKVAVFIRTGVVYFNDPSGELVYIGRSVLGDES